MTPSVLAPARRGHVPRAARPVCLPRAAHAGVLVLDAAPSVADVPGLSARLRLLLGRGPGRGEPAVLPCDVSALRRPDAGTLDVLARLQLAARRLGAEIRLRRVPDDLARLLAVTGLDALLPPEAPTGRAAVAGQTAGTTGPCRGRRSSR